MRTMSLWVLMRLCLLGLVISLPSYAATSAKKIVPSAWTTSYTFEAKGQYDKAAEALFPMLKKGDSTEFAWLRLGWLRYLKGDFSDAIDAYKYALRKNSESFDAKLGITLPLMAQKRWKEAIHYLNKVTSHSEWNYTANIRLIASWEGLKKWQNVKARSQSLAAHYPSETMPFIYLARALYQLGDAANSKRAYQQVLMRAPTNYEALFALK